MNKINIFILAAGLGERLRPITHHIPKPLLPILGKPILQTVLEKVSTLPVDQIGVNLHHKRELIEEWLKQSLFREKIQLFPEETLLGTGGALKNAEEFLSSSPFLVYNSDIVSDIDLQKLLEFHLASGNLVTLAALEILRTEHDYPEFNSLALDKEGYLKGVKSDNSSSVPRISDPRISEPDPKAKAFTGIAVYSPEFLKFLPKGISSVVDAWLKAIAVGCQVGTLDVSGSYWKDIGTPSAYASTLFDVLKSDGEMVYVHPSIKDCKDVDIGGYVVIEEECILDGGVTLKNCIMLPGSRAERGSHYEAYIFGTGFRIDLREYLFRNNDVRLIGTGGSDRRYYRVRKGKKTAVQMLCAEEDTDFQRHIEYTRFFLRHSVPVPELMEADFDKMKALFEDFGDTSLYNWLKCPRGEEQIEDIYRKIIDMLLLIHTRATEHVSECPILHDRLFDYEHFRWETGYFIERFVEGVRNVRIKNPSALEEELHQLALKADSFPKTVIHRDFQSQNIMITKGGAPRLIDYQGARLGPPAYDVVSILWDPYYRLEKNIRERLLNYYVDKMKIKAGNNFNEKDFRESLFPCRLQRHMQALGAYGFLSGVKGKKYFLKYAPEGLRLLKEDATLSKDEYPELYKLVMGL